MEESDIVLRGEKCARIIEAIHELYGTSLEDAIMMFYTSPYLELLEEGVADLHCRSEKYLASVIYEDSQDFRKVS